MAANDLLMWLAALTTLSVLLVVLFGRDEKPEVTALKRPPEGLNPAELGYAIDGYVDYSDVMSLLLFWAKQRNLRIEKTDEGQYRLIKLRDLGDDAKAFEKYLFKWVFVPGDEVEAQHYRRIMFRSILNDTRRMIRKSLSRGEGGIFTGSSLILKAVLTVFTAVPMLSSLTLSFSKGMDGWACAVIAAGILCVLLLLPEFGIISLLQRWQGWRPRARVTILWQRLALLPFSFIVFLVFFSLEGANLLLAVAAMVSTVIIGLCAAFISKRTPRGRELLGQAEGLRQFIENATDTEVAELQSADNNYYLSMHPYAYIFGLSGDWSRKFCMIDMAPPKGYKTFHDDDGNFNPAGFSDEMCRAMCDFLYNMAYFPGRPVR